MTALWSSFSSMDGRALYVWAAALGVLVFIVVELVLLEIRRRSIMQHLGQSGHESPGHEKSGHKRPLPPGGGETGGNK